MSSETLERTEAAGPLYSQVADRLEGLVERGTFRVGERLPSVRNLSREWEVSITTVMQAYRVLENRGVIAARPQSGFYVQPRFNALTPGPAKAAFTAPPCEVSLDSLVLRILQDSQNPRLMPLGAAIPDPALLPARKLHRTLSAIARRQCHRAMGYELTPGSKELRAAIARRSVGHGCALSPDDLVITLGGQEALSLALRAVCKPGDTVAVESPTYYGILQMIESQNLRALEIPTCPRDGISLQALRYAIEHHSPQAVISIPTYNNPLGFLMPEANKKELVELLAAHDIPLIEDDIYGELGFDEDRARTCKAFDRTDSVLLVSSFSKTLAPGYRVGWIAPGKYLQKVIRLKVTSNMANPTLPQLAVAEFLAEGGYDHHLRRLRRTLAERMEILRDAVSRHFPPGTRVTRPNGGFILWVEMPERVDSLALYWKAVEAGISISPGMLFSARPQFHSCIRLNAAFVNEKTEKAVRVLGALAGE